MLDGPIPQKWKRRSEECSGCNAYHSPDGRTQFRRTADGEIADKTRSHRSGTRRSLARRDGGERRCPRCGRIRVCHSVSLLLAVSLHGAVVFPYWKNSGMSASLTMGLFAATMPEAVLPCVVSLIVEAVWFAFLTKYIDRMWPPTVSDDLSDGHDASPSP